MLEGWVELHFEDGTEITAEAGDVVFIPGGFCHNEVASSDVFRSFEVFVPAQISTVSVDIETVRAARPNS